MGSVKQLALVLEDNGPIREIIMSGVKKSGYEVAGAAGVSEMNEIVAEILERERKYPFVKDIDPPLSLALADLVIGNDQKAGAEFARRLIDITGIPVVIVTGNPDLARRLLFDVVAIIPKPYIGNVANEVRRAIAENPRRFAGSPEQRLGLWLATKNLGGLNSLRRTPIINVAAEGKVVKIGGIAADGQIVNAVIYRQPHFYKEDILWIGLSSSLGCPVGCSNCESPCCREDEEGRTVVFKRNLKAEEMVAQFYLALLSEEVRAVFDEGSKRRIIVNFTCEGEPSLNIANVCEAIRQIALIERPRVSFIITSVGVNLGLKEFLEKEIETLPKDRINLYWSLNLTQPELRKRFMPGAPSSLESTRDLYEVFSRKTGRRVTASFYVKHGLNDGEEDARNIASLFAGRWDLFDIKLMPMVSVRGGANATMKDAEKFRQRLIAAGIPEKRIRIRYVLGTEGLAGCGSTRPAPPVPDC